MDLGLTFCLITGSCRGTGQQTAIHIAPKFSDGSLILLLSKELKGLQETKKKISEVAPNVHVVIQDVDFEKDINNEEYAAFINNGLKQNSTTVSKIQNAILIHNSGTALPVPALEHDNTSVLKKDFQVNFLAPVQLNTQFFKIFNKTVPKRTIIQVSSLASHIPMDFMGFYGSLKAARNHFFSAVSFENPTIRVLHYDPGVVNTQMFQDFHSQVPGNSNSAEDCLLLCKSLGYELLQPEETAAVLVDILCSEFDSGSNFVNFKKDPNLHEIAIKSYKELLLKRKNK